MFYKFRKNRRQRRRRVLNKKYKIYVNEKDDDSNGIVIELSDESDFSDSWSQLSNEENCVVENDFFGYDSDEESYKFDNAIDTNYFDFDFSEGIFPANFW